MSDLPRIAQLQPFIRLLHLIAVHDLLVEDAEVVAETIADRRQAQRGHGIEKTGGQTTQAAIAEARVHFTVSQGLIVQAQFRHGVAAATFQLQVDDVISEQAANQELERKIIDAFDILLVVRLLGRDPALDQLVSYREGQREVPVAVSRGVAILGQGPAKMAFEILPQGLGRHACTPVGDRGVRRQSIAQFGQTSVHVKQIGRMAGKPDIPPFANGGGGCADMKCLKINEDSAGGG